MKGIYAINNKINGKKYIGSSINTNNRWKRHVDDLKNNIHDNAHLQNAWNKYGENNFNFQILLECENENLIELEQEYIDNYNFDELYNINPMAGKPMIRQGFFNVDGSKSKIYPNIGDFFNDLEIISDLYIKKEYYYVDCKCNKCNAIKSFHAYSLIVKNIPRNCGCDQTHRNGYKHGKSQTAEYNVWQTIKNNGSKICDEWKNDFIKFLDDMGEKPSEKHIIKKIDVNDSYNPQNCIWTRKRYNSKTFKMGNIEKTVSEWAEEYNISPHLLNGRLKLGWNLKEALTTKKSSKYHKIK